MSKIDVVIQTVACLREREFTALMEEGYRERAEESADLAERSLAAGAEMLPEWL